MFFFSVTYSPFCIEAAFCENAFIMTEGALQTGALCSTPLGGQGSGSSNAV